MSVRHWLFYCLRGLSVLCLFLKLFVVFCCLSGILVVFFSYHFPTFKDPKMTVKLILWKARIRKDGTCAIKAYVYFNGVKKYYHSGLFVNPSYWDEKKGLVKAGHYLSRTYNARLTAFRNEVEAYFITGGTFEDFGSQKASGSLLEFGQDYIQEMKSGKVDKKNLTRKAYSALLNRLEEYRVAKGLKDLKFDDIDLDFYKNFCDYLLNDGSCGLAGFGKHIKLLKALMNVGLRRNLHSNKEHQRKEFRTIRIKTNKIYLTGEEIEQLSEIDLSNTPHLERERDRWLVAYYFLLRFSDVCRLSKDMFFAQKEKTYLRMKHEKTGNEAIIPAKPAALTLLEKYDYGMGFTANQVANRNIKLVAEMAGINSLTPEGSKTAPKSQFVTMHTARRSAATNLYLHGVSLKTIADLGGWRTVKSLMVYLRASGMDSARLASNLDFFQ